MIVKQARALALQGALLLLALFAAFVPALGGQHGDTWLIIPGVKAGPITPTVSESDLIRIYGKQNVRSTNVNLGEGESEPGTVLFPRESVKKLEILWKDQQRKQSPRSLQISGEKSLWKTAEGITLGTTLRQLQRINGKPFILAGFGWDYGGTIVSWDRGNLEKEFTRGGRIILRLAQRKEGVLNEEEYQSIEGDKDLRSDHKVLQKMNPPIWQMIVRFN